jgi:single-strand DNA-binding protein
MQKNRFEVAGYLAAKPELRYLPSGTKVVNARIGESYRFKDHSGETQTHTNWHSLTFYDDLADVAVTYEQGDNLYVEGTLQQRKFTPKDGTQRTVWEVIVRTCHLIEAARITRGDVPEMPAPARIESPEGDTGNATWPV